jgi:hypothetical protein
MIVLSCAGCDKTGIAVAVSSAAVTSHVADRLI